MKAILFPFVAFVLPLIASASMASAASTGEGDVACPSTIDIRNEMGFIAANIENLDTTRTPEGGAFKPFKSINCSAGRCSVERISDVYMVYEPGHVDADSIGYVAYPAINLLNEMERMIDATDRYELAVIDCEKN